MFFCSTSEKKKSEKHMTEMKAKLQLSQGKIKLGTTINPLSYKYSRKKSRIWKVLLKSLYLIIFNPF